MEDNSKKLTAIQNIKKDYHKNKSVSKEISKDRYEECLDSLKNENSKFIPLEIHLPQNATDKKISKIYDEQTQKALNFRKKELENSFSSKQKSALKGYIRAEKRVKIANTLPPLIDTPSISDSVELGNTVDPHSEQ